MEVRQNKATVNRPEGDRLLDAPIMKFDLTALTDQLKSESSWQHNDRNSITIFKSGSTTIVLEAMHPNAEMFTLKPENLFMIQVLEGVIELTTSEASATVTKNQFLALHEGIPYNLRAVEEAVFLLTVVEDKSSS